MRFIETKRIFETNTPLCTDSFQYVGSPAATCIESNLVSRVGDILGSTVPVAHTHQIVNNFGIHHACVLVQPTVYGSALTLAHS